MTLRLIAVAGLTGALFLVAGCAPYAGGLTKPPLNTIDKVALVRYDCGDTQIKVSYPPAEDDAPDTAAVVYHGKSHHMTSAGSADDDAEGARYIGDNLEWRIKSSGSGSHAALFAHRDDGQTANQTGNVIERCIQTSLAQ